jgi:hypothetical protein
MTVFRCVETEYCAQILGSSWDIMGKSGTSIIFLKLPIQKWDGVSAREDKNMLRLRMR